MSEFDSEFYAVIDETITVTSLKIQNILCLICCLISVLASSILIKHIQKHDIIWIEVKLFAVLSLIGLSILTFQNIMMNNSFLSNTNLDNLNIIKPKLCPTLLKISGSIYLISRYCMISFSLSRLRYFFRPKNSANDPLQLNAKFYYGLLVSYAIFVILNIIYMIIYMKGIILSASDNAIIQKCEVNPNVDSKNMGIYMILIEGLLQVLILYLYYTKYKQFQTMSMTNDTELDNKYIKPYIIKRSLILGILSILSVWTSGILLAVSYNDLISYCSVIIMFIIQICSIIFSFDIKINNCPNNNSNNNENDLVNRNNADRINQERTEYYEKVMSAYYKNPRKTSSN